MADPLGTENEGGGGCEPAELIQALLDDQAARWSEGDLVPAESYLERHPALRDHADHAVDVIYGEYLLRERRGEAPQLDEYLRRFPSHAAVLRDQIELHQAMAVRSVDGSARPLHGAASWLDPIGGDRRLTAEPKRATTPKLTLVAGSGPHSTGEIQESLRRRLRFIAVAGLVGQIIVVLFVMDFWRGGGNLPPGNSLTLAVSLFMSALVAALAAILWRRRELSLRRLRAIELILFGAGFAFWSWDHAFIYPGLRLAEPPFWFGMIMAIAVSGPWDFMIIAYGVFIPNTWRRCAAVVGVMALAPIVISTSTSLSADASGGHSQLVYLLTIASYTGGAAAIATYGAHRIEVLRQQVVTARRLGQYQLKRRLGSGAMGEVYLAEHLLLRRPCAIKLIRPERAGDPINLLRFEREVQVTSTLTHPNTVEILDFGRVEDGTFYYVMEYLPGLSLEQLVDRYGPMPPERVIHLLRQVCGALQEAHTMGLIHRDIKPGNVLVCERGGRQDVAKLLDFGLVHDQRLEQAGQKLTQEGAIAGTPAYMSPEQAAGKTDLDGRSDIYSLGALAYFLLTGEPPFVRQTAMQTLAAHIYETPVGPDGVPADLRDVVLRCLEKVPARRYPDADALDHALADCGCAGRWTRDQADRWWRERASDTEDS